MSLHMIYMRQATSTKMIEKFRNTVSLFFNNWTRLPHVYHVESSEGSHFYPTVRINIREQDMCLPEVYIENAQPIFDREKDRKIFQSFWLKSPASCISCEETCSQYVKDIYVGFILSRSHDSFGQLCSDI
jgi:hypothetical protein